MPRPPRRAATRWRPRRATGRATPPAEVAVTLDSDVRDETPPP
ncbi:MAG: hypothetical protein R3F43_05650 [bacterium]